MKLHRLKIATLFTLSLLGGSFADAAQPRPQGSPQEPVMLIPRGWKASWSPDGQEIAYGMRNFMGIEILNLKTLKKRSLVDFGKDALWSPDGRWIAVVREPSKNDTSNEHVWIVQPDGAHLKEVCSGGFPSWSGDGRSLFVLNRQTWDLMEVRVSSGRAKSLGRFPQSYYPAVSPDRRLVALGTSTGLAIADIKSGKVISQHEIEGSRGLLPAWSPDGRYVGFGGFDEDVGGLHVLEVATGKLALIWPGAFTMPCWSKDGTKLAFDYRGAEGWSVFCVGQGWIDGCLEGTIPAAWIHSLK